MRAPSPTRFFVSQIHCNLAPGIPGTPDFHIHDDRCFYQVAWEINPHMRAGVPHRTVRFDEACAQHATLTRTIRRAGGEVVVLPFVRGGFDSVFVKDNALIQGKRVLLARLRYAERAQEQAARAAHYRERGFIVRGPTAAAFEGGDVALIPARTAQNGQNLPSVGALLGYGFRSDAAAAGEIGRFIGAAVTPLRLVDPYLYHLDTALKVLRSGHVLVCAEAFDTESYRRLTRLFAELFPHGRIIRVTRDEALRFATNLVEVGETVILGSDVPRVARRLAGLGYRCEAVPLTQFHLAGGSAACLVSEIHAEGEPTPDTSTYAAERASDRMSA